MTLELIREALASAAPGSDWKIAEHRKSSTEAYAVGSELDLPRSIDALDFRLTVYRDAGEGGERRRGEATVSIHPTMSAPEAESLIRRALDSARPINPHYSLPEPTAWAALPPSGFEARPGAAWMREMIDAVRSSPAGKARLNSFEIFLTRYERRIANSQGVDASFASWKAEIEHTVEASGPAGDIELTDAFSLSEPDLGIVSGRIAKALALAEDRARAEPMPSSLDLPLVLPDRLAEEVLLWFFKNLDCASIYSGSSPFALGESLHGPKAEAGAYDPIRMSAESRIEGAAGSSPIDEDGLALGRTELARDGLAVELHGRSRYARYLGRPPVGAYQLFSVEGGSIDIPERRGFPHIEAAAFSSFDVDPSTGDFGGEIRLAYISDGKTRRPVTGGSITGSLLENRALMRMSRETGISGSMLGPVAVMLPRASIAGMQ